MHCVQCARGKLRLPYQLPSGGINRENRLAIGGRGVQDTLVKQAGIEVSLHVPRGFVSVSGLSAGARISSGPTHASAIAINRRHDP